MSEKGQSNRRFITAADDTLALQATADLTLAYCKVVGLKLPPGSRFGEMFQRDRVRLINIMKPAKARAERFRNPLLEVLLALIVLGLILMFASCASPSLVSEPTRLAPTEPSATSPGEVMTSEPTHLSPTEPAVTFPGAPGSRPGGDCIYSYYQGIAVVTRIEKTERSKKQAKTRGGYEGYEVWFVFETDQEVEKDWARKAVDREHLFQVLGSRYPYPGLEYLEEHHIKVGGKYPCTLRVIRSGSCTPIIFEFDQFN